MFKTHSGTGATALIISGFGLVVVGALGDRITRLRYGDAEIVFELIEDAAQAEASGDTETAEVLMEAALRRVSGQTGLIEDALYYELAVIDALRRVSDSIDVRPNLGVDGRLTVDGVQIGFVVKLARMGRELVRSLSGVTASAQALEGLGALLVITRADSHNNVIEWAEERLSQLVDLPLDVVVWKPGASEETFREALARLVDRARTQL